jgi:hypothetical protein
MHQIDRNAGTSSKFVYFRQLNSDLALLSAPSLVAVLDLTSNDRDGLIRDRDISRRQGFPRRYLEPLLQRFVHVGIL